jgi:DNA-binding MarR family transcriptional regulator
MMRILLTTYLRTNRTCEEAARTAGYEHEKATKRVSDLERLGLITDTGQRRPGSSGRLQKVCAITTKGREAL